MFDLDSLVRQNIKHLVPFSSARGESEGRTGVYLDANESPFDPTLDAQGVNRYPDPFHKRLRENLATIKGVEAKQIVLGNGSDELITLIMQVFGNPRVDSVLTLPPTFTMFKVSASIADLQVLEAPLLPNTFAIDQQLLFEKLKLQPKIVFFCSPNNPTGNLMDAEVIQEVLRTFNGIVVVDEAYFDFVTNQSQSFVNLIGRYPNLVVLQTFSKAWGAAGYRVGALYADANVAKYISLIKPPYNISLPALEAVNGFVADYSNGFQQRLQYLSKQKEKLFKILSAYSFIEQIYPSQTNFFMAKFTDAEAVYNHLLDHNVIVRNLKRYLHGDDCLRVTVGSDADHHALKQALDGYAK